MLKSQRIHNLRLPEAEQAKPPQRKLILSQDQLAALMKRDADIIAGRPIGPTPEPRPQDVKKINHTRRRIIRFLRKRDTWTTTAAICKRLKMSNASVRNHANFMVEDGSIIRKMDGPRYLFKCPNDNG